MTTTLLRALQQLLRPAVRLAIRNGLKVQDIFEALKTVSISVAEDELRKAGESHSKSKIAVITGLQRRDITRLMEPDNDQVKATNIIIRLIGQWGSDKRFSKGGKALELTFEGVQSEFFALVQSISKDLNPYTLLFELERLSVVERRGEKLHLKVRAFEARESAEQGLMLWSQDVTDLIDGVEENIFNKDERVPNLHIATRYDNIVLDQVATLRRWVLQKGADFHAQVRAHLSQFDKDLNPTLFDQEGGGKVVVTSFSRSLQPSVEEEGNNDEEI